MTKRSLLTCLKLSIFVVSVASISTYLAEELGTNVNNTTLWWVLNSLVLFIYWKSKQNFFYSKSSDNMNVVLYYLIWNFFEIGRGLFIAETYWDWKGLFANSLVLLIPLVAYTSTNTYLSGLVLRFYIRYTLPLFLFFAFFISRDAYGFYLVPIGFLMIFLPLLKFKWKVLVILSTLVVLTADLGARSNVIKFFVPILLLFFYWFDRLISIKIYNILRWVLLIMPIILFSLAVSGSFNIFKMDEYLEGDFIDVKKNNKGETVSDDLSGDTRTFLYVEVLQSALKNNFWILGRSPARGNETEYFAEAVEVTGRKERLGNEVAILNVFTWTGLVGVILYFLVFYRASFLAINRSNSIFCKMLGLFIAFRWTYAWVEDINIFTLNYYFIWFMIGICFSKTFRSMSDKDFKLWVNGIFEKLPNQTNKLHLKG